MKNALRKLDHDRVDDIIVFGALCHPSPMDNILTYNACKHDDKKLITCILIY